MNDYKPWEFDAEVPMDEDMCEKDWFDTLRTKYKTQRTQLLPEDQWQPLIDKWLQEYPDPDTWFVLHVKPNANADLYRTALKRKGFTFREVENQYQETPIYLETPLSGLDVDQDVLLETIGDMENRNSILYYRNIPAPVIDLLYEEVFEEHLVYPERFN